MANESPKSKQYYLMSISLQKIEPSFMEFNVKADLSIEPDGAYLLEGGVAHLQLFEKSGVKDEEGNFIKRGRPFYLLLSFLYETVIKYNDYMTFFSLFIVS